MKPALRAGLALLVGGLAALAVAGPDLAALWAGLPGALNDDGLHAIYLHHQVHDALAAGRLDLSDPQTLWPVGAPLLRLNGGNILEMLVSGALRGLLPWPAWLSAASFAWIPLNVLAFLPLGRALWGRTSLALAGGVAWALTPTFLTQLGALRLTQIALVGLPLAVLGLLRLTREGGRPAWALTGVGMALLGLGYWFYVPMLAACTPAFVWTARQSRPLRSQGTDLLAAAALSALLVSPLLGQIAWASLGGAWMPDPPLSAEFSSPVFPNALSLTGPQPYDLTGWLPLVLLPGVVLSVLRRAPRTGLWLACAALCTVCALGPAADALGYRWLLPYYPFWRWVPGVDRMSHPDRWLLLGALFWVLASFEGLAASSWGRAVAWLAPAGVLVQSWVAGVAPLGTWSPTVPAHWEAVASLETAPPGAVVVLPLLRAPNTCAWQHHHGQPLLGGMVENQPWFLPPDYKATLGRSALLHGLWGLTHGSRTPLQVWQADLDALHATGFRLVVLDRRSWQRHPPSASLDPEGILTAALGEPVWRGPSGVVWRLPAAGRPGTPPDLGPLPLNGPPGAP